MRQPKYRLTTVIETMNNSIDFFTKRSVEQAYCRIYRSCKKDNRYSVEEKRIGYFTFTYLGEYAIIKGEVFISKIV